MIFFHEAKCYSDLASPRSFSSVSGLDHMRCPNLALM